MAVLIGADLAKDVAGAPLLRGVSLTLERRDRLTLSGRNGSGKTTLLRMLAGEASIDGGELTVAKDVRVALHDQRPPLRTTGDRRDSSTHGREEPGSGPRDIALGDYILSGCAELVALEAELARLEQAMADGDYEEPTLNRYATAQARLEHAGGYGWRDRALDTVRGLGFGDVDLDRRLDTFSGGELTRASLARVLASDPDLLLLDEPTNHLDIASLEWLEKRLRELDAAIVLVAHDRWFLEAVGTSVLELEGGRSRFFKGTWSSWRKEKAAREIAAGRAAAREAAERDRLERFVTRFRAGTRARQAQSRLKRLDKLPAAERRAAEAELGFAFKPPARTGRVIFELEQGELRAGEKELLHDGELWLERGEHVSLVGPNGAGKTTLVSALAGLRELDGGRLRRGHNLQVGFLSQHAEELDALPHSTVLEATQKATGLTPNKARALLGRFLFSGEEAEKPVAGLSGGERRRVSLAVLVNSGANVLILDEPTNHLDLESREALEDALRGFEGSLLLVSHDRALLDAVGTRTIAFEDRGLRSYVGGWAEYTRLRDEERELARPAANGGAKREKKGKPAYIEQRIEAAEAHLAAAPEDERAAAQRAVDELYAEWARVT